MMRVRIYGRTTGDDTQELTLQDAAELIERQWRENGVRLARFDDETRLTLPSDAEAEIARRSGILDHIARRGRINTIAQQLESRDGQQVTLVPPVGGG